VASPSLRLTPAIAAAIAANQPVVALESSVLAQGLPIPANADAARRMTDAVSSRGAVPAITAVVDGTPTIGLTDEELQRFLRREGVRKVSARDLPVAMAQRADGATTVAATLALMRLGGVKVFATGGIGGVHRDAPFDESADLPELADTPAIVVCAGAKSILDLPATVERLETLGVTVVGYRTHELPGFFHAGTGIPLACTVESAEEVAELYRQQQVLGRRQALLVVQPPPAAHALPREVVEGAVSRALRDARSAGIRGAQVTPYLLGAIERETGGRSLAANLALLEANAALAAEIAVACALP
jgi:pseudouridine-5'-phosphate glycosidase